MNTVYNSSNEQEYWDSRYETHETGWDIGEPSTPLKTYIDQLRDKSISVLIPGAGNAYEAAYLYENGFFNALPNIAIYYLNKNDLARSLSYLNKHNEIESEMSLINLAIYYQLYNVNYALMKQFYLKAIKKFNSGHACLLLSDYYNQEKTKWSK